MNTNSFTINQSEQVTPMIQQQAMAQTYESSYYQNFFLENNDKNLPSSREIDENFLKHDIGIINILIDRLNNFLTLNEINHMEIENLLKHIAMTFEQLSWNNDSANIIRNKYGRINHNDGGKENEEYLDVDMLSRINYIFENDILKKQLLQISHSHIKEIKRDFEFLKNSLLEIITRESTDKSKNKIKNPSFLENIVNFYADYICLMVIYELTSVEEYTNIEKNLDIKEKYIEARYSLARIITRLGEASKHLSINLKLYHQNIPLAELSKIRNELGHKLKLIKNKKDDFCILLKKFSSSTEGIILLNNPIKNLISLFESIINSELEEIERLKKIKNIYPQNISKENKKITHLKKIIEARYSKIKSIENQPPTRNNQTTSSVDTNDKEARIMKRIAELEQKGENSLNFIEKKCLDDSKKSLKKLQEKQINRTAKKDLKELKSEHDTAKKELLEITIAPVCYEILDYIKQIPKISKREDSASRNMRKLQNLIKELKLLAKLFKAWEIRSKKNHAVEYCLAIIGQYLRDIKIFIENFKKSPKLLTESKGKTVYLRNKKVMHDFLHNFSSELENGIDNYTLTMTPDLEAIQLILANDVKQIETNMIETGIEGFFNENYAQKLAKLANDVGFAYYRLCQYTEAEEFFKSAFKFLSAEFIVKEILKLNQNNIFIIESINPIVARYRFEILDNLNSALFHQKKYKDCLEIYKQMIKIYIENSCLIDFSHEWLVNYSAALYAHYQPETARRIFSSLLETKPFNKLDDMLQKNSNSHATVTINIANAFSKLNNYHEGLHYLNKIDIESVADIRLKIEFLNSMSCIKYNMLRERLSSIGALNVTDEDITTGEYCSDYINQARLLLNQNEGDFKRKMGDYALEIRQRLEQAEKLIDETKAIAYGNYAMSLSDRKERYKYLVTCLNLQEKHQLSTDISYLNLGQVLYEIGSQKEINGEQGYEEDYKKSIQCYLKITENSNQYLLAIIRMGYCNEKLKNYQNALGFLKIARDVIGEVGENIIFSSIGLNINEIQDIDDAIANCKLKLGLDLAENRNRVFSLPSSVASKNSSAINMQNTKTETKNAFCGFKRGFLT